MCQGPFFGFKAVSDFRIVVVCAQLCKLPQSKGHYLDMLGIFVLFIYIFLMSLYSL